jgi:hypothetical protein
MGQGQSNPEYSLESGQEYTLLPEPGTYRITSILAHRNVIEVPEYNQNRSACAPWSNTLNQQVSYKQRI